MATAPERRRFRACGSCWSDRMIRGTKVEGVTIEVAPAVQNGRAVTLPVYANICRECGMVSLFVRKSGMPGEGGR
jgi:hypothetical protein